MIAALIIVCITLILVGGYFVHIFNKGTPRARRWLAVITTMAGAIGLWFIAAVVTPAVDDVEVKIVGTYDEGILASFKSTGVRHCKIESVEANLILKNGNKVNAEADFVITGSSDKYETGFIAVQKDNVNEVESASFVVRHYCPFGFHVDVDLLSQKLPAIVVAPKEPPPITYN